MRVPFLAAYVEQQVEKAVTLRTANGSVTDPGGSVVPTELAIALGAGPRMPIQLMPRAPVTGAFNPGQALPSAPLDPSQPWGLPLPRRGEYPVQWNIQIGPNRQIPFGLLYEVAWRCDVVRRCIDIRKQAIQAKTWDLTLTPTATARFMAQKGEKSPARAEKLGKQQYAAEIERLRAFWEEPDPDAGLNWSEWVGELMEQHFVWDAPSVYPRCDYTGQVKALWVLDGSTIKPLLDQSGGPPQPPFVAYQQILYGYPRGEFTASPNPDAEFASTQLIYRPRDRQAGTPYGRSPVEKALPLIDLYMQRQQWLAAEYRAGATPRTVLVGDQQMLPEERLRQERLLNQDLQGNNDARHSFTLLPGGFTVVQLAEMAEKYGSAYDNFLITQIGSRFAVMPTQLGIIPTAYGILGRATQPGDQDISETLGDQPLEEWLVDVLNIVNRQFLGASPDLTMRLGDSGIDEDAMVRAQTDQLKVNSAQRTVNEIRAENGDDLYKGFPEADMPFVMAATGPVFLEGSSAPKPTPAPFGGGTPQGDDSKPPQTAVTGKAAQEGQAFLRFAGRRRGGWRDFEFDALHPTLGNALNAAGQRGDLDACKALVATIPKAQGAADPQTVPPFTQTGDRIAEQLAPAITEALTGGETAERLLSVVMLTSPQSADSMSYVSLLQSQGLEQAITERLAEAMLGGISEAVQEAVRFAAAETDTDPVVLLRAGRLSDILAQLKIDLEGVSRESLDRIGDELAEGVERGEPISQMAQRIEPILHDPKRAQVIARTEVARAMERASFTQATEIAQMPRKSWLTANDERVCPICAANAAEGAIPIHKPFADGELTPPAHPNCRCTTLWLQAGQPGDSE